MAAFVRVASWIVRIPLAFLFLFAGAGKLAGQAEMVATFETLGLGQWLRLVVGACEVAGGFGLLVTPLAAPAAVGLAALMAGAVLSHLLVLGPSAAPAAAVLVLAAFVAWAERDAFRMVRMLRSGKGPMDGWVARAYDRGVQAAFREMFPVLAGEVMGDLQGARRVLDVGCGPGQFTVMFAESAPGAEVWGIDLAPTMIELAQAHAAASRAATRLHFDVADVVRLPFPDGTFDAVISSGSIKHWPDPVAGLREIHRVLAPGGRLLIGEMNRLAPSAAIAEHRRRLRHWFFRWIYPRVFGKALSPDEAHAIFRASPFGEVRGERMLLGGCLWLFRAEKADGGVRADAR
jgi:ubiquinone/menaquinone biosynthesis C-methylase UbiE